MIRVKLVIYCDHEGCERSTTGNGGPWVDVSLGTIHFREVVVPPLPNGDESGWYQATGGRQLCPEHAPREKA
jgi:hypothetical protein